MQIDWNAFTPAASLAGGLMVGLAAALFILLPGRVLGISGIVGGLLGPWRGDAGWRLAFIAGLAAAPLAWLLFSAPVAARVDAGPVLLVVSGLLVGWGTRRGSGCTSGHGVCGVSRQSPRSWVATAIFVAAGFACVYVLRHVLA